MASSNLLNLIQRFHVLGQEKAVLEEQLKEINKEYDRLRTGSIPEAMAEDGIQTIKVEGIGRVGLTSDVYVSYADNKEAAFMWLAEHGLGACITETVNASTLKAAFRKMIREGEPLPDDIFRITPFSRASITKA